MVEGIFLRQGELSAFCVPHRALSRRANKKKKKFIKNKKFYFQSGIEIEKVKWGFFSGALENDFQQVLFFLDLPMFINTRNLYKVRSFIFSIKREEFPSFPATRGKFLSLRGKHIAELKLKGGKKMSRVIGFSTLGFKKEIFYFFHFITFRLYSGLVVRRIKRKV